MTTGGSFQEQISNIRDQVTKTLEETFSTGSNIMVWDIYETNESIVVVTNPILGLDTASLDISITGQHHLTVSGESHMPADMTDHSYIRRERKFGKFSRSISLPVAVLAEEAKASFKNHVLTITIPKEKPSGPKVVKVTPVE